MLSPKQTMSHVLPRYILCVVLFVHDRTPFVSLHTTNLRL